MVATSAVAGPVTLAHNDRLDPTSFSLAILSVDSFCAGGNHSSQKARAQYLTGPVWASKARSAVPLAPSSVAHTKSMFLPPAFAALAVAAVALTA